MKKPKKYKNGIAKTLSDPVFRQRVKPGKKKVQKRIKKIDPVYPI